MPLNITPEIEQIFKEYPMRSGYYNWAKVFNADIAKYDKIKERLEEYDVVHINMSPANWWMILDAEKRLRNSSTKLVVNNDHVSEHWHKWRLDPMIYLKVQECGDLVFGTEPFQTSQMIDKAVCMPHPTDTKAIKIFKNSFKSNSVGILYHGYDPTEVQIQLMAQAIKKDLKCPVELWNYVQLKDEKTLFKNHFDKVHNQYSFSEFCMALMRNKVLLELAPYHTYGRITTEIACLKVPVVGSDRVGSMRHNYPFTSCDPYDHRKIRGYVKDLFENDSFKQKVVDTAYENVEYYSFENCKKRMLEHLEGVRK